MCIYKTSNPQKIISILNILQRFIQKAKNIRKFFRDSRLQKVSNISFFLIQGHLIARSVDLINDLNHFIRITNTRPANCSQRTNKLHTI